MSIRIEINGENCIGAGQCALTAPGVFDQDDDGFVKVLRAEPGADEAEAVRLAESVCPSQSIVLVETD